MRDYNFKLNENDYVDYSTFIHWVNLEGENYLVGRISHVTNLKDINVNTWIIEYFEDCLDIVKDMKGFFGIPGFPSEKGLVRKYINGRIPFFLEQRIINSKRNDLPEILAKLNMKVFIPLEYMDKMNGVNIENRYFTSHNEDAKAFYSEFLHYYTLPPKLRKTREEFSKLYGEYKEEEGVLRISENLNINNNRGHA